jgi:uncharacterized protein
MQTQRVRGVALAVAVAGALACGDTGPLAVIQSKGGPVKVGLEVAATDTARAQGLMYRHELADGRGMLFVFPSEEEHKFWMKNTMIGLDMVFVGADGRIVGIHENAAPLSLDPITVGRPSKWVLEVPAGFTKAHTVAVGDRIDLRGVPSA